MFSDALHGLPTCTPASPSSELERVLDGAYPAIIDGVLGNANADTLDGVLSSLLAEDRNASVILDQSPWNFVPIVGNSSVTRPAQRRCSLAEAVDEILSDSRRHHAYVRHQSIDGMPALRRLLESSSAMRAIGRRVQMRNLWLGLYNANCIGYMHASGFMHHASGVRHDA